MPEMQNLSSIVCFGAYEANLQSRELRKHGLRIRLEEKPFRILEMLLGNAGQVVKRETLCARLWPDTYVGFEHSLNTAVNKLRDLLGDRSARRISVYFSDQKPGPGRRKSGQENAGGAAVRESVRRRC